MRDDEGGRRGGDARARLIWRQALMTCVWASLATERGHATSTILFQQSRASTASHSLQAFKTWRTIRQ